MENRQMRFTQEEIDIIKSSFKGNEKLLKLLRKVFLPELDPDAPLGQQIDLWMTVPVKELDPQHAMVNILARNHLISHIEQQLISLSVLANTDSKTMEEVKEALKKDSSK